MGMNDLLDRLDVAIEGDQPPADWKALLREVAYTAAYVQEENAVLKRQLEQASKRLGQLSKPLFDVGDAVTIWLHTGGDQNKVVYGEGSGVHLTGTVTGVEFRQGGYSYEIHDGKNSSGNISEHLIRKVG